MSSFDYWQCPSKITPKDDWHTVKVSRIVHDILERVFDGFYAAFVLHGHLVPNDKLRVTDQIGLKATFGEVSNGLSGCLQGDFESRVRSTSIGQE